MEGTVTARSSEATDRKDIGLFRMPALTKWFPMEGAIPGTSTTRPTTSMITGDWQGCAHELQPSRKVPKC